MAKRINGYVVVGIDGDGDVVYTSDKFQVEHDASTECRRHNRRAAECDREINFEVRRLEK
jgi:hypothetical protein